MDVATFLFLSNWDNDSFGEIYGTNIRVMQAYDAINILFQ